MSDGHPDAGVREEHEADSVDITDDGEVELNLPREVVDEQVRPRKEIRWEPLTRVRLIKARRNDIGLSPQMEPDLNGPDTDCPFLVLWSLVVQ